MKKLFYLLVAVSLMLALVPAAAFAHTEEEPFVTDLIAGGGNEKSAMDVGDVLVWNDADYLYVRFVTDGTCMTETHLHVATSLDDIPQKNGNPIPGKFTYSEEHGCATDYTYPPIPLQGDYGTPLYIAAHAALGAEETMTFYSDGEADTWVTAGNVPDATYPYPAVDTWEAFNDPPDPTPSYWEQRLTYNGSPFSFSAMADWIWESYRVVDPTTTQDVTFEHAFTVNGYPTSGKLYIATDNMYNVSLNGVSVGEHTDWRNWQIVGGYDIYPVEGTNVLQIIGSNYGDSSYNLDNNPAGLIFEAEITYLTPGETAWGAGFDFPGKNWATYFTYTVQHPVICADFSGLDEGASVEGLGTVAPYLEIDTPTGDAVKIVEGGTTSVYGAPNKACGHTPILNGGIGPDGGFSDKTAQAAQGAHSYTFTFTPGAVNDFSLHMLDFGDWNPSKNTHHYASMTAYDAGDNVVDTLVLEYNSDGAGNPRHSDHGDLLCGAGDAIDADPLLGEPGNWTWNVSGSGIVRVELSFGDGYDPNIGFDTLCFVLQ